MQTHLAPAYQNTPEGQQAQDILRQCVHCGFCTATCPTYQLLGDELDGPRGRIYLIKQMLEGQTPTRKTQQHLDRCLTCRNCESTCPSGVQYAQLLDIGRQIVEREVPRRPQERVVRWLLKEGLTSSAFAPALQLGRALRSVLPNTLRQKIPASSPRQVLPPPTREHARKVLLLAGCVQPSLNPNIHTATVQVLDACGIQSIVAPKAACCGALKLHLNDHSASLDDMRNNIDAWWPWVDSGAVEYLVMNASGCGVTVKEYGHHLRHDPAYADKAQRISALTRDVSELLPELTPMLQERIAASASSTKISDQVYVYHPPCTLQHGQQVRGHVETHLRALGFNLHLPPHEAHLCCGSAGTYSVLEPQIATALRERKLTHVQSLQPAVILSANIGCIGHLQSGTNTPVRHWIEEVAGCLI